jgi:predicted ArsR family transcriptional regulator
MSTDTGEESTGESIISDEIIEFLRGPRARMLDVLATSRRPAPTSDLVEHAPVKRSAVRYHLDELRERDLIEKAGEVRGNRGQKTDTWRLSDVGREAWEVARDEPGIRGEDALDADPLTRQLSDDVARVEQRLEQVEDQFEALDSLPRAERIDDLRENAEHADETASANARRIERAHDRIDDAESKGSRANANASEAVESAEHADETASEAIEAIERAEESIESLRSDVESLRGEIEDVREDLSEHRQQGKISAH